MSMSPSEMSAERVGRHWIGGAWSGRPVEEVRSPHDTRRVIGQVAAGDVETVADAVGAAWEAASAWARLGQAQRGQLLFDAALRVERAVPELAALAALEMGKPVGEARGEAVRAVQILRYYAGEGLREVGSVIPATYAETLQYTRRVPVGVVGIITPWNFPLAIPMWKMAPALVYGNTVVLKPAEWASLTAAALIDAMREVFPAGVLNLVLGQGRVVGEALVADSRVDAVSFTGSESTGRHIAQICVGRGAKYQLEMGGKNAVIVADDADLETAVEATVSGAMRSAGQKCTATSRIIVLPKIRAAFEAALVDRVKHLRQGDPSDAGTYLGPVVSAPQHEKIMSLIARGQQEGARLVAGGDAPGGTLAHGHYVAPTVFRDVTPAMTIAQEEIFGPVVGLMPADSAEDAFQLVNGVRFGLSASIFTRDLALALRAVEALNVGLVRVNEETAGVELQAPFGGMKASSSHSREQGPAARDFYTDTKTVAIRPV